MPLTMSLPSSINWPSLRPPSSRWEWRTWSGWWFLQLLQGLGCQFRRLWNEAGQHGRSSGQVPRVLYGFDGEITGFGKQMCRLSARNPFLREQWHPVLEKRKKNRALGFFSLIRNIWENQERNEINSLKQFGFDSIWPRFQFEPAFRIV